MSTIKSICQQIIQHSDSLRSGNEIDTFFTETHANRHKNLSVKYSDKIARTMLLMEEVCTELLIPIAIMKDCGCEPGNAYEPEFICGWHRLSNKAEDAISQVQEILKDE